MDEATAVPFVQCDYIPLQFLNSIFEEQRQERFLWCQMDFINGHRRRGESAAANEAGTVLPNREKVLPDQAVDGTPSHMPAQVLWALLFLCGCDPDTNKCKIPQPAAL